MSKSTERFENLLHQAVDHLATNQHQVCWRVPGDLIYFSGHFPGDPILPGVAILEASSKLILRESGARGVKSVPHARFHAPIRAGENSIVQFKSVTDRNWEVEWRSQDQTLLAELKIQVYS